jgi:hypothetical protein
MNLVLGPVVHEHCELQGTKGEWITCDHGIPFTRDIMSTIEIHLRLRREGYPALIFR